MPYSILFYSILSAEIEEEMGWGMEVSLWTKIFNLAKQNFSPYMGPKIFYYPNTM